MRLKLLYFIQIQITYNFIKAFYSVHYNATKSSNCVSWQSLILYGKLLFPSPFIYLFFHKAMPKFNFYTNWTHLHFLFKKNHRRRRLILWNHQSPNTSKHPAFTASRRRRRHQRPFISSKLRILTYWNKSPLSYRSKFRTVKKAQVVKCICINIIKRSVVYIAAVSTSNLIERGRLRGLFKHTERK